MTTTRKKDISTKKGFTLIEILITISLLAIGFAGVFTVMQSSSQLLEKTKNKTLAINLTRQAIEGIQNIRDTNRTKRAGSKDACRLKTHPGIDTNNDGCENDEWIQEGWYILSGDIIDNQKYFSLNTIGPITGEFQIAENALVYRTQTQLCQVDRSRESCDDPNISPIILRAIYVSGLYNKQINIPGGQALVCTDGTSIDGSVQCGGSIAKELRFCATTRIINNQSVQSTLCSSITNFTQ